MNNDTDFDTALDNIDFDAIEKKNAELIKRWMKTCLKQMTTAEMPARSRCVQCQ